MTCRVFLILWSRKAELWSENYGLKSFSSWKWEGARLPLSVERKALNLVVVGSSPTVGVYFFFIFIFFCFLMFSPVSSSPLFPKQCSKISWFHFAANRFIKSSGKLRNPNYAHLLALA